VKKIAVPEPRFTWRSFWLEGPSRDQEEGVKEGEKCFECAMCSIEDTAAAAGWKKWVAVSLQNIHPPQTPICKNTYLCVKC